MRDMEEKRVVKNAPYGYKKDAENPTQMLIDEAAAEIVRRIYHMFLEGKMLSNIARRLEEEGVTRPSRYHGLGRRKSEEGKESKWSRNTIRYILTHPCYNKTIISEDEWIAVQKRMKNKMKSRTREDKEKMGYNQSSRVCYGYLVEKKRTNSWMIDEPAADVVRKIYKLYLEGGNPYSIAKILEGECIERPSYYLSNKGMFSGKNDENARYKWSATTVRYILTNPEYAGHGVTYRTYLDPESKKYKKSKLHDLVVFPNMHEAIIPEDIWLRVQERISPST